MRKILFVAAFFVLVPGVVHGFVADDFQVNNQSTYSIPPSSKRVLILDLTLSEPVGSIKLMNAGTAQQSDFSKISVFGDGSSPGFDGDETELFTKSLSPFWDVWLSGFSRTRIFITADIASTAVPERTIQPQLQIDSVRFDSGATGPTDEAVTGFERTILAGIDSPAVPITPKAGTPQVISDSAIRWHFTDMSNNEFGFKILDADSDEVVRSETADVSYIDETGLLPDTEYSGRRVVAFNDRGTSLTSTLSVFPAVRTLAVEPEETVEEAEEMIEIEVEMVEEETAEEPSLLETIKQKIAGFQQQLDELFERLADILAEQGATMWTAFQRFYQSLFGR